MMKNDIESATWDQVIMQGMVKASAIAIDTARQTNTKLAVWLDGKVVEMTPDEWIAYQSSLTQNGQSDNVSH